LSVNRNFELSPRQIVCSEQEKRRESANPDEVRLNVQSVVS
jgi:hypothetical protein